MSRVCAAILVVVLGVAAAGCGGSSAESSGGPPPATTGAPPSTPAKASTVIGPDTVTGILRAKKPTTPLTASLRATGHSPVAGADWTFIVKAKNKDGTPTMGTVRAILLLNGKLYDTIGWYGMNGKLSHSVVFPLDRKDLPLVFQAQLIANGGVVNLNYPLKVR
jgi:hypothetical protein